MRFKFIFFVFVLFAAFLQSVSGQPVYNSTNSNTNIYPTREFEGRRYSYSISANDFKDTPSWNPLSGDEPPLSVKDAVKTARNNLKRFVKDIEEWEVNYMRFGLISVDKWYYEISFSRSRSKAQFSQNDKYFVVYVKMDGAIVEPVIKEIEKK